MKDADTTKKIATKHDWSHFDSMSEKQRHAAAVNDPDAQPVTPDNEKRMERTPQVKVIRRALGLSQEAFALRFHVPLGTLRDWEQIAKSLARRLEPTFLLSPEIPKLRVNKIQRSLGIMRLNTR